MENVKGVLQFGLEISIAYSNRQHAFYQQDNFSLHLAFTNTAGIGRSLSVRLFVKLVRYSINFYKNLLQCRHILNFFAPCDQNNLTNTMKHFLLTVTLLSFLATGKGQSIYRIDASQAEATSIDGNFRMGNPGPVGKEIVVNSRFLTIGGMPVVPVMGEIHPTRVPRAYWEESLLKMKAAGVNIVAFYVIWNHHEEVENQFVWSGDNNIRAFVELCAKHGLYAYPRIGPWVHGEARNGGFPDWLLRKKEMKVRQNDPVYDKYVERFFHEIGLQLAGLYYKDGGPIIGVQLENEYWRAKSGEAYILWLKRLAISEGMDVPLYTVTGWKNGSVPPFEVIPLFGAYPDAPWASHVGREVSVENFSFDTFRDNDKIGDEVQAAKKYMSYSAYPYFTCEMGIGIQNTYHRRLVIDPKDGLTMALAKLGSGSNLIGYYVFAGGTNPRGILHSQTEDQEETGYSNRNPDKSYDFQAAIRETGEISDAYKEVKKLHYFLHDFGSQLALTEPVILPQKGDGLHLSARSNGNSGFLFGINYCRYVPRPLQKKVSFELKLQNQLLQFPKSGIDIPDSTSFIWPFNLSLGNITLRYATAQVLCKLENAYVFYANDGVVPEFSFDSTNIAEISLDKERIKSKAGKYEFLTKQPGKQRNVVIRKADGSEVRLLVLSESEARNAWVFENQNKKEFYLSEAELTMNDGKLGVISKSASTLVYEFAADDAARWKSPFAQLLKSGVFNEYMISNEAPKLDVKIEKQGLFADSDWLESNGETSLTNKSALLHRFFVKEFSLENSSAIRSAVLYVASEQNGRIQANGRWVSQDIASGKMSCVDLTGYLRKGENKIYLEFPYVAGIAYFAGKIVVTYDNTDRVEIATNSSWLAKDAYSYPSELRPMADFKAPKLASAIPTAFAKLNFDAWQEWKITLPEDFSDKSHAAYLSMGYVGDVARIYAGSRLIADNFNSNQPWRIALNRLDLGRSEKTLRLIVTPSQNLRIFQDIPIPPGELNRVELKHYELATDTFTELTRR